jgi:hypothetical protein
MKVYVRDTRRMLWPGPHALIARLQKELRRAKPLFTTWFICRLLLVIYTMISACALKDAMFTLTPITQW